MFKQLCTDSLRSVRQLFIRPAATVSSTHSAGNHEAFSEPGGALNHALYNKVIYEFGNMLYNDRSSAVGLPFFDACNGADIEQICRGL